MTLFRILLALIFVTICGYTAVVVAHHGPNLVPVFFGDITKLMWPGQFNLDFSCMLLLSGLWVSHRHRFRPVGLLLGLLAVVGGVTFLSLYLLIESFRTKGDIHALLLGQPAKP